MRVVAADAEPTGVHHARPEAVAQDRESRLSAPERLSVERVLGYYRSAAGAPALDPGGRSSDKAPVRTAVAPGSQVHRAGDVRVPSGDPKRIVRQR
jgi:hypothetical protein